MVRVSLIRLAVRLERAALIASVAPLGYPLALWGRTDMRRVLFLATVAFFAVLPAFAQQAMQVWVPLGYQQIANPGTATSLTLPTQTGGGQPARWVRLCASTQIIRYRDDGVAPTASSGEPIFSSTCIEYSGNLSAIQFIAASTPATLDVSYYR